MIAEAPITHEQDPSTIVLDNRTIVQKEQPQKSPYIFIHETSGIVIHDGRAYFLRPGANPYTVFMALAHGPEAQVHTSFLREQIHGKRFTASVINDLRKETFADDELICSSQSNSHTRDTVYALTREPRFLDDDQLETFPLVEPPKLPKSQTTLRLTKYATSEEAKKTVPHITEISKRFGIFSINNEEIITPFGHTLVVLNSLIERPYTKAELDRKLGSISEFATEHVISRMRRFLFGEVARTAKTITDVMIEGEPGYQLNAIVEKPEQKNPLPIYPEQAVQLGFLLQAHDLTTAILPGERKVFFTTTVTDEQNHVDNDKSIESERQEIVEASKDIEFTDEQRTANRTQLLKNLELFLRLSPVRKAEYISEQQGEALQKVLLWLDKQNIALDGYVHAFLSQDISVRALPTPDGHIFVERYLIAPVEAKKTITEKKTRRKRSRSRSTSSEGDLSARLSQLPNGLLVHGFYAPEVLD